MVTSAPAVGHAGEGRWALLPGVALAHARADGDELAEQVAGQLLERWGVVFYDLLCNETLAVLTLSRDRTEIIHLRRNARRALPSPQAIHLSGDRCGSLRKRNWQVGG